MLQITYKNRETRVINLHPSFFAESSVALTKLKISRADAQVSLAKRCLDMALGFNGYPYKVNCIKNGVEVFGKTWLENKPVEVSLPVKAIDAEKAEKKQLRKEHKNTRFTQKWDFTTGMFTNLITGEQMYSTKAAA